MKKYLFGALALPLLFACSSDDLFEKEAVSNDQFAGIEKVDAIFTTDESGITRMGTEWGAQEGDRFGFAWLTDAYTGKANPAKITLDGNAYQNHPLDIVRDATRGLIFKPQTSIYVGKYYIYYPYDETVVDYGPINFSLADQPMTEADENDMNAAVKALAKKGINIGDKWTEVTPAGRTIGTDPTIWDKAGIDKPIKLYPATFSNQTALELSYKNNKPDFKADKVISGASDINYTIAAGTKAEAADIFSGEVQLDGAAKSFTYAPTLEPNTGDHSGSFWADKKALPTAGQNGFGFKAGAITLTAEDEVNGISTDGKTKGWFWFNSLPNTAGTATLGDNVTTNIVTSYGTVQVVKALEDCAYVLDKFDGSATKYEWIKLVAGTGKDKATSTPKEWGFDDHNTFINEYGDHKGKYAFEVDFKTADMSDMHIKNDTHLQKALMFYLASGKNDAYTWYLDGDKDTKEFRLSKISIALIQSITGNKVKVQACTTHNIPVKIIITQDGSAGKTLVPNLNGVFAAATDVYLAGDCTWTWSDEIKTGEVAGKLTIDAGVNSITNLGTLNVTTKNIELSVATDPAAPGAPEHYTLTNAKGATMNITDVTTVKNALTNLGIINVGSTENKSAELRAYGAIITNDATGLKDADPKTKEPAQYGIICNYGVVGSTAGTTGEVNNYGYIKMMNNDAITLLTSNATGADAFATLFKVSPANKMGVVELPEGNATALVSVNNADANGSIKYKWTGKTYATPAGNVKYNTIIVSDDITFSTAAPEIQYIEFDGIRTQVVNDKDEAYLNNLKGIYVHDGKSIIIEKDNKVVCSLGAFLGDKATVYQGGTFTYVDTECYYGTWSTDQIVKY